MDFSSALIRLYNRICEIAPVAQKESLRGLQEKTLTSQFVAGARGQSARLELRWLELANSNKTFNEIRDLALELFQDIERAPKPKYGQVRYLETEFLEGFEDGLMLQSENEICINGLTAQTERTGQQQQGNL